MPTDEILLVRRFAKDTDGSYVIKCRHCRNVIGVEDGEDDGTPRGEQYKCRCGGWNQVDFDAVQVRGGL
ncbi:hypothetical protein ACQUFY_21720 [Robbsia andropogonis]|uniref:hypothetical protein n=1 Tax=Robbsia andropogonis TaxID=28092 RepID=UPI003D20F109